MKRTSVLTAVFAFCLMAAPQARAIEISPVILGNWIHGTTDDETVSASLGLGAGVLASFPLAPALSLETGLLYMNNKATIKTIDPNNSVSASFKSYQIPVLVRFEPLPMLSVGGGGYYSFFPGHAMVDITSSGVESKDESGLGERHDFGLELAAGARVPVAPGISVLGDLRYLLGLRNTNGQNSTETATYTRTWQLLAGVSFSI